MMRHSESGASSETAPDRAGAVQAEVFAAPSREEGHMPETDCHGTFFARDLV